MASADLDNPNSIHTVTGRQNWICARAAPGAGF